MFIKEGGLIMSINKQEKKYPLSQSRMSFRNIRNERFIRNDIQLIVIDPKNDLFIPINDKSL